MYESINEKFVQNIPLNQAVNENEIATSLGKYFERPELHVPLFFHTKFNFVEYPVPNSGARLSQLKIKAERMEDKVE